MSDAQQSEYSTITVTRKSGRSLPNSEGRHELGFLVNARPHYPAS